jgi:hypothetical protein
MRAGKVVIVVGKLTSLCRGSTELGHVDEMRVFET